MVPLVLYHDSCADGFTAAWVARGVLPADTEFLAVNYGQEPPDVSGRAVMILDFSFKRDAMTRIISQARRVCVLDHHKTAQAELTFPSCSKREWLSGEGDVYIHFDMAKSGGRLTWEHFYGESDVNVPWLVEYTEDRDLWRWKLPESREVNACLASWPRTFEEWDKLALDGTAVAHFAEQGAAILRYQRQVVDSHCAHAVEIDLDGHKVLSLNATTMISEIGEKLAEGRPFSATWFVRDDGKKVWSLRSREGGIDVSEIAKRHGGGGHRQAAGFETVA